MTEEIAFFYPSQIVGGAETSLIQFSKELVTMGHRVSVIDYPQGYLSQELANSPVNLIPYEKGVPFTLPETTTALLLTAMVPTSFLPMTVLGNPKVIIHSMHPLSYLSRYVGLNLKTPIDIPALKQELSEKYPTQYAKLKESLNTMARKKALISTETTNLSFNQKVFEFEMADMEAMVCPGPCAETSVRPLLNHHKPLNPQELHIGWVGRLSAEKTPCIIYVLENLNRYVERKEINVKFYIIGEGPGKSQIQKIPHDSKIELIFTGSLVKHELDYFIKHKIDVLFAMGIALLDGAKLKVPAVITDSSLTRIDPDYKVSWLFESINFLLGEYSGTNILQHQHSFAEIMDAVYQQGLRDTYGERCYQHFMKYHSPQVTTERLLSIVEQCEFRYQDFTENNYFTLPIQNPVPSR